MQNIPYTSAVGSLMYAQVCTGPDIAFIVAMLGRYMSNPRVDHWKAAKRVMRYLKRTKDFMLTYRRSDSLEIFGYSDSDFSGYQDSKRSTSGYVFMLARGVISWRSAKQTLIASSTMAAEFIACYEASNYDALNPGCSLTTRQPEEYSRMSGDPTSLTKIEQSPLCTGSSTQM